MDDARELGRIDVMARRCQNSNARVSSTNLQIDGVNTLVANVEAQLRQAQYYLDNTTLVAPEDGRIINLQVRPGEWCRASIALAGSQP